MSSALSARVYLSRESLSIRARTCGLKMRHFHPTALGLHSSRSIRGETGSLTISSRPLVGHEDSELPCDVLLPHSQRVEYFDRSRFRVQSEKVPMVLSTQGHRDQLVREDIALREESIF